MRKIIKLDRNYLMQYGDEIYRFSNPTDRQVQVLTLIVDYLTEKLDEVIDVANDLSEKLEKSEAVTSDK